MVLSIPKGDSARIPFTVQDATGAQVPLVSAVMNVRRLVSDAAPLFTFNATMQDTYTAVFAIPPATLTPAGAYAAAITATDNSGGQMTLAFDLCVTDHA